MIETGYIGLARTEKDVSDALALATLVFRPDGNAAESIEIKRSLMSVHGMLSTRDVVISTDAEGTITGTCFLVDRFFFRRDKRIQGTFLTSICMSPATRGKGLSLLLMEQAIRECEKRGSLFGVLIARKAVDHYYNKISFWGLSQYTCFKIGTGSADESAADVSMRPVKEDDLPVINNLYETTFKNLYGAAVRTENYWKHIIWKSGFLQLKFIVFQHGSAVIGYAIFSGQEFYEMAVTPGTSHLALLQFAQKEYSVTSPINFYASEEHPIIRDLAKTDLTISKRQCSFGGHMVRVINHAALLSLLEEEIAETAERNGIKEFVSIRDGMEMTLKNSSVSVRLTGSPHDFKNTCLLMGAKWLTQEHSIAKLSSFNIPLLDQA